MGKIDSYNITLHALQVYKSRLFDLLKHPKDILSSRDIKHTPFITLGQDSLGGVTPTKAVELEITDEDSLPHIQQAVKNIDSYAYAFYGGKGQDLVKARSHLIFWINCYIHNGDTIQKLSIKYIDMATTNDLKIRTSNDSMNTADEQSFESIFSMQPQRNIINMSKLFKPSGQVERTTFEVQTSIIRNMNSMSNEMINASEGAVGPLVK